VIKQIFGVIKSRFHVLATGCKYNITIQVKVIIVMTFLHNFIQVTDPTNNGLSNNHLDGSNTLDHQQPETLEYGLLHQSSITQAESSRASIKRDNIAQNMWIDYQKLLRHQQQHGQAE
jgi:hypothetical protein